MAFTPIEELNGVKKHLQTDTVNDAFAGDQSIDVNAAQSMFFDAYVQEMSYRLCTGEQKPHTVPPPGHDEFCRAFVPYHTLKRICDGDAKPSTGAPPGFDCNKIRAKFEYSLTPPPKR